MSAITPPTGWNISVSNYEDIGELTLENKQNNVKIHCNNMGSKYKLTAIHMLDGTLDKRTVQTKENIEQELYNFVEQIESNYLK